MVKERLEITLDPTDIEYLNEFGPRGKSKVIGQALQLHKVREVEPKQEKNQSKTLENVEIEL